MRKQCAIYGAMSIRLRFALALFALNIGLWALIGGAGWMIAGMLCGLALMALFLFSTREVRR